MYSIIDKTTLFLLFILIHLVSCLNAQVNNDLNVFKSIDINTEDSLLLNEKLKVVRVVMLGEPSHGEGIIMEMNIKIIKFLHEEMGFNTIAFESGFYDLYKAQRVINEGGKVEEALNNSVFPIWTKTCEFQELIKYIHKHRKDLKIIGFDCQLTGTYSIDESIDDLKDLFERNKIDNDINFKLLQRVFIYLGEYFSFPSDIEYGCFIQEMDKVQLGLKKIIDKEEDVHIWNQFFRSTKALAKDYIQNNPSQYTEKTFKAWVNNPRDKQMADNLLYHLKKYPTDKVVCIGASAHFANSFKSFHNLELRKFIPMGYYLKDELGEKVFSIAPITGNGTYGIFEAKDTVDIKEIGSIEYHHKQKGTKHEFINLKEFLKDSCFISHAIDYSPLEGKWSDVFDSFVFVEEVVPTTYVTNEFDFSNKDVLIEEPLKRLNDSLVSMHDIENFTYRIKCSLYNEENHPIPFANIFIKNTTIGTISNKEGRFVLNYSPILKQDTLCISCIGFENANIPVNEVSEIIYLTSKQNNLNEVTIVAKSLNPNDILKKAIEFIPLNYPQRDYNAELYSRGILKNYDSILVDVENVAKIYDKNGYDGNENITQKRIAYKTNRLNKSYKFRPMLAAMSPLYLKYVDLISVSPLFSKNNLKKYQLELRGTTYLNGDKVYKIYFNCKQCSNRYTGLYYIDKFDGLIYINANDYGVLKIDANWVYDVDKLNISEEFRANNESINVTVTYNKRNSEKYFFNYSEYKRTSKGIRNDTKEYCELAGTQKIFLSGFHFNNIEIFPRKSFIKSGSKCLIRPNEFWENYNKPFSGK